MFFIVSKERLVKEIELRGKGQGKGTLNWFFKDVNGIIVLHVLYFVNGIHYLYTCNGNDIPIEIRFYIQQGGEILGIIDSDSLYNEDKSNNDVEEIVPEEVSLDGGNNIY